MRPQHCPAPVAFWGVVGTRSPPPLHFPQNSPNNISGISNPPGTPRDDGELGGNFLHSFQNDNVSECLPGDGGTVPRCPSTGMGGLGTVGAFWTWVVPCGRCCRTEKWAGGDEAVGGSLGCVVGWGARVERSCCRGGCAGLAHWRLRGWLQTCLLFSLY